MLDHQCGPSTSCATMKVPSWPQQMGRQTTATNCMCLSLVHRKPDWTHRSTANACSVHTNVETDRAYVVLTAFAHLVQNQRQLEVLSLQIQHELIWTAERLCDASETLSHCLSNLLRCQLSWQFVQQQFVKTKFRPSLWVGPVVSGAT